MGLISQMLRVAAQSLSLLNVAEFDALIPRNNAIGAILVRCNTYGTAYSLATLVRTAHAVFGCGIERVRHSNVLTQPLTSSIKNCSLTRHPSTLLEGDHHIRSSVSVSGDNMETVYLAAVHHPTLYAITETTGLFM